jgi:RNA polymerase sigma factor (sigma-70 family)
MWRNIQSVRDNLGGERVTLFKWGQGNMKNSKNKAEYEKLIFEMFYHRVYNSAYFIVQDQHLAQDIVQETFLKAFQRIDTVKDGEKLGAWLGAIATRTSIDFLRKLKRIDIPTENVYIDNEVTNNPNFSSSIEELVENKYVKALLYQNISELKPEHKEVLLLKYEYDLKDKEIAKLLGIKVSTAKSRIHRGKTRLRDLLMNTAEFKDGDIS